MEGLKRLETEVQEMNNHNVFVIFEYLKTREDLKEKFENEEKSIKGMFDFICDKARKQAVNNVAMIQDNIVYLWAVTYFTKSNEELGIKKGLKDDKKDKKEVKEEKTEVPKVEKVEEPKVDDAQMNLFQEVSN